MLERIVISKVRIKLLRLFLLESNAKYHVRGLVRLLGDEINAIRRETENLRLFGILKSEKMGNKLVFSLDNNCIFIKELRALLMKDTAEIQLINKVLSDISNIDGVVITKAYMDREYANPTDIDILVLGKPNVSRLSKDIKIIEKSIGRELRLTVLTAQEFDFQRKRREKFILDIMENEKLILIGELSNLGL